MKGRGIGFQPSGQAGSLSTINSFEGANVMRRTLLIILSVAAFAPSANARGPMFLDRPTEAWLADLSDVNPEARRRGLRARQDRR